MSLEKDFLLRNLEQIRKFYLTYSISETLWRILEIQKSADTVCGILIRKFRSH